MAARFYPVVFLFSRRRLLPSHFQPWALSSSWWPPSFTSTPDPRWSTDPSITTTAAAATTSSTTPASVEKLNQLKVQKRLRCIFDFLKFPVWKKLFRFLNFYFGSEFLDLSEFREKWKKKLAPFFTCTEILMNRRRDRKYKVFLPKMWLNLSRISFH